MVKRKKAWTGYRVANLIADIICWTIVGAAALTCIIPFIHILAKSLSDGVYVISNQVTLYPKADNGLVNLDAYLKVFQERSLIHSLWVTVYVTVIFTAIGMFLTMCAAYALSRPELKGRFGISLFIMFTMYFGAGAIPDYLLMSEMGLLENVWSLILPLCFAANNLLIMRNNIQGSIPDSLVESARIDGANHFTILGRIVIPLSKPIIATISLFYAVGRWNAYSDALMYIKQRTDLRPLQLKVYYLLVQATETFSADAALVQASTVSVEALKAATIIFTALPIICVYPFLQKYFVKGTMVGAIKG